MEPLAAGTVVLVPFPFSDLSQTKLRPAVVLADAGRGDFVLCQVTSNTYADSSAIELTDGSFATGTLQRISYARPGKLFTAHEGLIRAQVGHLHASALEEIRRSVTALFRPPEG